ncbi:MULTISPECIES: polymer-forming cytoskeletal protein [unclassified Halorubrum]|uniref:polymer-forming cytoskeletal protein n=1 Tax=unclassified Halorubrum TaxID=2642239 RepID=UPI000B98A932|nr:MULTISPECIES: polymer-forming cytoskeletal protein [unclassified Halorubrum]OYR45103.1 cell shape determination protein CcmA [Halorubrum sp. Hd13]OYR48714.1 cell shape determination protein CcmA [Halorubrum sp. Ea1]OYR50846.1 cell shape determination protein CcmA [Halorubrum sp. Ea8]
MDPSSNAFRRRIAVALAVVALLFPLATGLATAQSVQGASGTIVVDEGETVDGIDGVAGTIVVRGTVDGDLSGAAGSIRVAETGRVDGNVQAAAGTIVVDGTVGGNVETGAGSFELTDTGRIGGSLDVGAGSITVDGAVDGDVRAAADSVVLGPNADVGGEFRYDAETFTESPDATVAGGVVEDTSLRGDTGVAFGSDLAPSWVGSAYGVAVNLALGAVLLLAFPRFSRGVADRVGGDSLRSGGVGLVALIGTPILLVLVAVTVVGIPLALVGIAAYVVAIWIGSVYGRYALGSWVLNRLGRPNRWVALLLGVLGIAAIGLVPWVGGLVDLLVLLLGLGALALGLRDRYRGARGVASDRGSVGAD